MSSVGLRRDALAAGTFSFLANYFKPRSLYTNSVFTPEILFENIKKYVPELTIEFNVDPVKQAIADSWPNSLDDTCAREEWGWNPKWDMDSMTQDMLKVIGEKHAKGLL